MSNFTNEEMQNIAMLVAKELQKTKNNGKSSGQVLNSIRNTYIDNDFADLFGLFDRHKVWDGVLQLTKQVVGVSRIFDVEVEDIDFAKYVANDLCRRIIDLRIEYLQKKEKGEMENKYD